MEVGVGGRPGGVWTGGGDEERRRWTRTPGDTP